MTVNTRSPVVNLQCFQNQSQRSLNELTDGTVTTDSGETFHRYEKSCIDNILHLNHSKNTATPYHENIIANYYVL